VNRAVDLLDVNVWLALSLPDHPHHPRARKYWFEKSAVQLAFCRITSLALSRLLTQPKVMGGDPLTVSQSWKAYRAFRELPEVTLAPEPDGCEARLGAWTEEQDARPRLWTDAYLAAFAISGAFRLVTFDRDFQRFSGLSLLQLEG